MTKVHKSLRLSLEPPIFQLYEAYDPSLVLIKILLCAAVLNRQQILLGTEDGLYCVELTKNEFVKITDKKVFEIDIVDEPDGTLQLLVIISGNRRTIRLLPRQSILGGNNDQNPIKIEETKGSSQFCLKVLRIAALAL